MNNHLCNMNVVISVKLQQLDFLDHVAYCGMFLQRKYPSISLSVMSLHFPVYFASVFIKSDIQHIQGVYFTLSEHDLDIDGAFQNIYFNIYHTFPFTIQETCFILHLVLQNEKCHSGVMYSHHGLNTYITQAD